MPAGAFSNFLKAAIRAHLFKATAYSMPTVMAIALETSDPTPAGTNTEVTNANAYARQGLNPSASANWTADGTDVGLVYNTAQITFPTATGSWGTITYGSIWDNATYNTGDMLFSGPLQTSKVIGNGDIFIFAATNLSVDFI